MSQFTNAAERSVEEWAEYLIKLITPAYAEREAGRFTALRAKANTATAALALASYAGLFWRAEERR